jgi:hypothetical protein
MKMLRPNQTREMMKMRDGFDDEPDQRIGCRRKGFVITS